MPKNNLKNFFIKKLNKKFCHLISLLIKILAQKFKFYFDLKY